MEPKTFKYAAVPTLPLSGGKREDGDGELLVARSSCEGGPLDGAVRNLRRAIFESVGLTRLGVAAGEDDRLEATVELRKRDLERDLHRVQTERGVFPLLGGLEGQRHGDHVRHVELLQGLDRLRVILPAPGRRRGRNQSRTSTVST